MLQVPAHRLPQRDYQKSITEAYFNPSIDQLLLVIARRGGKTSNTFAECVVPDLVKKKQTIVLVYPIAKMGFRNFWMNIENDGTRTLDHIPKSLIKNQSNTEDDMRIELINGSVFMVLGATNVEALRGANGKVYWFDEFSDMPIEAVNVVAPIVEANGGKLIYTGTPKIDGINGETMRRMHFSFKEDSSKYTCYIDATNYMTTEQLEKSRQGYILRNGNDFKFRQEMLLDWGQSLGSSYYGQIMSKKDTDKTIGEFAHNPAYPVYTAWDLGRSDSMVIIFFQNIKGVVRMIDIHEAVGSSVKAMIPILQQKPYNYGWHFLPHDGTVGSTNDGVTRIGTLHNAGITNVSTLRREGVGVGIGRVEDGLPNLLINLGTTGGFNRNIRKYKRKYNPETGNYMGPDHKSQSHIADALRYMYTALHYWFNEKGECELSQGDTQQEYASDLAVVTYC
jgi:phage terminase large subunit